MSSIPCCGFGNGTKRKCATWEALSKGFQRSPPSMHFALKGSTDFTEYFEAVDMTNIHLLRFDISATPAAVKRGKSTSVWSTANVVSTRTRSSEIFFNPKHERLSFWINVSAYYIMQGRATNLWIEMAKIGPVAKKHGDNDSISRDRFGPCFSLAKLPLLVYLDRFSEPRTYSENEQFRDESGPNHSHVKNGVCVVFARTDQTPPTGTCTTVELNITWWRFIWPHCRKRWSTYLDVRRHAILLFVWLGGMQASSDDWGDENVDVVSLPISIAELGHANFYQLSYGS